MRHRLPTRATTLHHRRTVRITCLALGVGFVALGVIGIFLPLLPTTPFMLLAAACFARSSERFHDWLLNHRIFGTTVRAWQQHRSIPRRAKWLAILTMAGTLSISIVTVVSNPWLQFALAVFGAGLAVYLYRIPSRD